MKAECLLATAIAAIGVGPNLAQLPKPAARRHAPTSAGGRFWHGEGGDVPLGVVRAIGEAAVGASCDGVSNVVPAHTEDALLPDDSSCRAPGVEPHHRNGGRRRLGVAIQRNGWRSDQSCRHAQVCASWLICVDHGAESKVRGIAMLSLGGVVLLVVMVRAQPASQAAMFHRARGATEAIIRDNLPSGPPPELTTLLDVPHTHRRALSVRPDVEDMLVSPVDAQRFARAVLQARDPRRPSALGLADADRVVGLGAGPAQHAEGRQVRPGALLAIVRANIDGMLAAEPIIVQPVNA
mmetsp:Transcript_30323/g.76555  ORF Transcript_30323/g.76555 Transcript_30323/m.76555 type:complete len:295 (+) Transcript_30323:193-1077(+)